MKKPAQWKGRTVLITAGPTREYLDPVRFITNGSTGKMGYALAAAAQKHGATVFLVSGPTRLSPPAGVHYISVETAEEMCRSAMQQLPKADVVIAAAAVGDWKPRHVSSKKMKKDGKPLKMTFVPTVDILKKIGMSVEKKTDRPLLVGFALETDHWIDHAREKLECKGADLIVANKHTAMGSDQTRIAVLSRDGKVSRYPVLTKARAASEILHRISGALAHGA